MASLESFGKRSHFQYKKVPYEKKQNYIKSDWDLRLKVLVLIQLEQNQFFTLNVNQKIQRFR